MFRGWLPRQITVVRRATCPPAAAFLEGNASLNLTRERREEGGPKGKGQERNVNDYCMSTFIVRVPDKVVAQWRLLLSLRTYVAYVRCTTCFPSIGSTRNSCRRERLQLGYKEYSGSICDPTETQSHRMSIFVLHLHLHPPSRSP